MKRLNGFKDSLEYIEDNLRGDIDYDIVARKAMLSKFYYFRMFQIVTGTTLAEYIRNRKMSLAAKEIKETGQRILDIALSYGYGSQEAFSRAFKAVQGITPAQVRKPAAKLKAYPPISFQLQLKGDVEMDYSIVKKDSIGLLGISRPISSQGGTNFKEIPLFWQETMQDGTWQKLMPIADDKKYPGCFGVCMNYDSSEDKFDYVIGVSSKAESGDYKSFSIPADTYAVFGPVALDTLQDLWKRIFSEWLPATEYEIADGPQIEYYPPTNDNQVVCEVWIPIKK